MLFETSSNGRTAIFGVVYKGSIPFVSEVFDNMLVAQLDRASDYGSEG